MMEPEYEQFTRRFTSSIQSRLAMTAGEIERFAGMQHAEIERLQKWVDDLQSGMYINCVYCGHRYGPREDTPVSMMDVLREHIEQCPKHPLSEAKSEIERLRAIVDPIKELRGEGCDYITLHVKADHEAGRKREAVDVVAAWTNWKERWFWGDTIEEALATAAEAKRAAEKDDG